MNNIAVSNTVASDLGPVRSSINGTQRVSVCSDGAEFSVLRAN